ncbi:hypothetical protein NKG94_46240 [Micromonospora sp. M12]
MQDTVAVALITSLSTLAAAALTGLVGARSTVGNWPTSSPSPGRRMSSGGRRVATSCGGTRTWFLSACDQAYRQVDRRWLDAGGVHRCRVTTRRTRRCAPWTRRTTWCCWRARRRSPRSAGPC